ncbi:MAG: hypothetical protein JXJ04_01210 [Spirochaetales bacterium]|nr:hypothetical protein [Spirochaetales bacterium]
MILIQGINLKKLPEFILREYQVPAAPCSDINSNENINIIDSLYISRYYVVLN